ncbi:MAG TPA: TonB-dependent receptor [Petrimonas sp.]|uniref:SusC/RagA family TonB-linked outer membrane protein n=1 Tax=Petrimonas sp. TaxID=2023866 RepID=UPI0009670E12|nr:MAG: SusC/RagA family TonB-linked outer membrane protein [Bacteroidia bacterium 43-41]HHV84421.1 TonB-dependent receptor [Petrimonas sp.]
MNKLSKFKLFVWFLCSVFAAHAQDATLSGVVTDVNNNPLIGVNVVQKGTAKGTITNYDGEFSFQAAPHSTIVFTYIGFAKQEVAWDGSSRLNVTLHEDSELLEEVVVVGYGTQRKVNLTGAVSQISASELEDRPVANMSQILQGTIPNLNVHFSSGQPGVGGSLNIRGTTSINGGGPLVLIDGVPGDINRINPYDVESVSVLKDASASAIYGARGAFGVILVTTKSAKEGKMTISYNNNFGWSSPTVSTDFLTNGYEHVKLNDEAFLRSTGNTYTRYSEEDYRELEARRYDKTEHPDRPWIVVKNVKGKDIYNYYGNYDWWNTIFTPSQASQQHNINLSGGNEKLNFMLSGSYYHKDGIMKINTDKFNSYTLRSKISAQLLPWLNVSNNTQYYYSGYKYQGREGGGNSNFVNITVHALPAYAPVNPDGTPTYNTLKNNYSIGDGLYALLLEGKAGGKNSIYELVNTTSLKAKINDNISLFGDYSYTLYSTDNWYRTTVTRYSIEPGILQEVPNYNSDQLKQTRTLKPMNVFNIYTNYNQSFSNHNVAATAGINYEYTKYSRLFGSRRNLLSETLNDLNLGTGDQETSGGSYEYTLFGAFFRANYDYAGKYLFEMNGRYDGTSRFGSGSRYGFFPSFSVGYRISEESFWEPIKNIFTNMKIRASYGTLGNQLPSNTNPSSFYPYISLMSPSLSNWITDGQKIQYINSPRPISPDLTWEKSTTTNLGIDLGFVNNKLNISGDAYKRRTFDMLIPGKVLPAVFGASVPTENAGDLETKGFELSISWRDQFHLMNKPFSYSATFGLSDYVAKITKYDNPTNLLSNYYVGQTLGEIWGYSIEGIFKSDEEAQSFDIDQSLINRQRLNSPGVWSRLQAGDLKFKDLDGDKKISPGKNTLDDPGDRRIIGNTTPRYRFGLNLGFNWNGIDFSTFIQGIGKRDWYPGNNADKFWGPYSRPYYSFIPRNFEEDVWTPENRDAYFPLLRGYTALNADNDLREANDRYIQNAGYIRLKNLILGYSLPASITRKMNLEKFRIYVSGENLGYYTPMHTKYIDPEQLDGDETNGRTYPMSKVVSFGFDITL